MSPLGCHDVIINNQRDLLQAFLVGGPPPGSGKGEVWTGPQRQGPLHLLHRVGYGLSTGFTRHRKSHEEWQLGPLPVRIARVFRSEEGSRDARPGVDQVSYKVMMSSWNKNALFITGPQRIHDITLTPLYVLWRNDDVPDSKVHGANMGPTWVLSPQIGPMNFAIRRYGMCPLSPLQGLSTGLRCIPITQRE